MALSKAFFLACLIVLDTFVVQVRAAEETTEAWAYTTPDKWPPICLTGRRQSPVPVNTYEAQFDQTLASPMLRYFNFNFMVNGTMGNPGNRGIRWTVDMPDEDPKLPKIVGGGLPSGDYFIRYLDFRWAGNDCEGSDHYMDFKPAPLEIQLVAYRSSKASTDGDFVVETIAVFSYIYQYGDNNPALTPIITAIDRVTQPGASTPVNITLSNLFPALQQTPQFYRYNGSLAIPPCSETVAWTIFAAKQPISRTQMLSFKRVQTLTGLVQTAFRPLQQLNARRIATNVRSATGGNVVAAAGRGDAGKAGTEGAAPASIRLDTTLAAIIFAIYLFA